MTPDQEQAYVQGQRAVWGRLLKDCLRELGYDAIDGAALLAEREETIAMLREVCREHGDNDWPDDLHMTDIIEKHLWRHLEESDDE